MKVQTLQDVVDRDLCISCGVCAGMSPRTIRMKEYPQRGMYLPTAVLPRSTLPHESTQLDFCPGRGYPLVAMGLELFADTPSQSIELGRWRGLWAVHMTEASFLSNAASGGIMTGIAAHLLRTGRVSGCVVTGLQYGKQGPRPSTFIARTLDELLDAQGSKYCPVPALAFLPEMMHVDGRLAFIGTPCQIAAVRLLQRKQPIWRQKIAYCIGNFCGGFSDLRETDALIRRAGLNPAELHQFRYRWGGQPGSMYMEDKHGRTCTLPYPDYARYTGFVKHKRCRLCVDATAELADFACGDAWIPRFLESGKSWSLILTRSAVAEEILQEMFTQGKVELSEVTIDEVKKSQKDNLSSKKTRQHARRKLYSAFGIKMPEFDGGYNASRGGLFLELRVQATHMFFSALERLKLYPIVAKAIGRYR